MVNQLGFSERLSLEMRDGQFPDARSRRPELPAPLVVLTESSDRHVGYFDDAQGIHDVDKPLLLRAVIRPHDDKRRRS